MIIPRSNGELLARFKAMRIKHPRAEYAFAVFDDLREGKRKCPVGSEQVGATMLAPSHSGKSTTVRMYIEKRIIPDCIERGLMPPDAPLDKALALQRLAIHVTLTPSATVGSLMTDLLKQLGDPRPDKGTVAARRHRVYMLLAKHATELALIDEIQHLGSQMQQGAQKNRDDASTVQNSLKKFMLDGMPIVFIGRPEAKHKIFGDEQVDLRVEEEIDFNPLDYSREDHRKIVRDFCGRLAATMYREGIYDHIVDLVTGDFPECICAAVEGRLGLVAVLVRWATRMALADNAETLTRGHLAAAVDQYLIPKLVTCRTNPFLDPAAGYPEEDEDEELEGAQ